MCEREGLGGAEDTAIPACSGGMGEPFLTDSAKEGIGLLPQYSGCSKSIEPAWRDCQGRIAWRRQQGYP
jgi:hypothetical protein